ncbi:hypothetical protein [Rhizorhabdus phycosphaerae]|uniref:hypothetical protein n=1 Tax=Rhizorhabdus phycosphaerae TaxID=2711156 RepID=UPI0013EA03BF|nr:hypothetical protein [Rhizorhabdus phycosphaerae]
MSEKRDYSAIIGIAFFALIAVAIVVKIGRWMGVIEPLKGSTARYEPPQWDRRECLNRNAYRIRQNDPLISDEMLNGDVARACVLEENAFYGRE